ncbi:MAG: HlyC/CorC family transporter [candidate division Zixibacteria bacterium]|nr:HlyC/CorC family transporter [candidate division Zixibacteria bacterium]
MLPVLAMLAGIIVLYYISYSVSVAASGLYLTDSNERKLLEGLSDSRRASVEAILDNPKRLSVTATLVQSGALIVSTVLWFLIGSRLELPMLQKYALEVILIAGGWFIHTSLVAVIAPNLRREQVLDVIQSKTWLLRLLMAISAPAVTSIIRFKSNLLEKQDLEEKKEEIVERAIEELADSAGIDEPLMGPDLRDMIGNVFDLADSEVREIMIPRIEMLTIDRGTTFAEVKKIVAENGYSRYPVIDGGIDNIAGVLHVKDILKRYPLPADTEDVTAIARPAFFVPESKSLRSLLEEFKHQKVHMAIAVDEYGGTAGLVTMEDILELIVGDIQDEHDTDEESDVVKLNDSEYIVSANLSMTDLSDRLELRLEEKEFETVGGYIYDLVGSLPDVGQRIATDGLDFVVEQVNGQRIEKVRIIVKSPREQQA